jgi:hypothetical protein
LKTKSVITFTSPEYPFNSFLDKSSKLVNEEDGKMGRWEDGKMGRWEDDNLRE